MTATLDLRPMKLTGRFIPGEPFEVPFDGPAGWLAGFSFTATLGDEALATEVVGDRLWVRATDVQSQAAADAYFHPAFVLFDVTSGTSKLLGPWYPSETGAPLVGDPVTVTIDQMTVAVTVLGGSNTAVNSLTRDMIDVSDHSSVAAANDAATAATLLDGEAKTLWFPGTTPYTTPDRIELASNVGWLMPKGGVLLLSAPGAGVTIPDPRTDFYNINLNGGSVATDPLIVGDTVALTGAKSAFWGINIQAGGAGGNAARFINLQNSTGYNWRVTGSALSAVGWLLDYGTKNLGIYGLFGSTVNGPNMWVTTGGGAQQTSKINVYYGLMENADGIILGDCEQVFLYQVGLNGGGSGAGISIVADGNRDGTGVHAGSTFGLDGCQIKNWVDCISLETGATVQTRGLLLAGTNGYRIESAQGRIKETAPNFQEAFSGAKFVSTAGLIEQEVVTRSVAPRSVAIVSAPTLWTNMPSALTEFVGVADYRQFVNLAEYRFARLSARTKVVGSAGAKLRLAFRPASVQVVNNGGATAGSFKLIFDPTGVSPQTTASIAYNAAATGANSVQTKLEGLSNIVPGEVAVTGAAGGPWTITFAGQYAGKDLALMAITADTTTGGTGVTIAAGADTVTTIEVPIDVATTARGVWGAIPAAAQVPNCMMLLYGLTGDGVADPQVGQIVAEFA